MLLEWMHTSLWVTLGVWLALYISDYTLTLVGARWRNRYAPTMSMQGSYELNPYFVKDINAQRKISVRFILAMAWTSFILAMLWLLTSLDPLIVSLFDIGVGAMILSELAIHVRHLRNLATFRHKAAPGELSGQIAYSRRYLYWLSALDLALFALLYLVVFLFVGNLFFVGGALSCSVMAFRHRRRVKREPLLTE